MPRPGSTPDSETISVMMAEIKMALAPGRIRTVLGSCIGVALYDRQARTGALGHVVLPDSRGQTGVPGKFADTCIPRMVEMLVEAGCNRRLLTAKICGGASMFKVISTQHIGKINAEAVRKVLDSHSISILAEDIGGELGRRMTFDVQTGSVLIEVAKSEPRTI